MRWGLLGMLAACGSMDLGAPCRTDEDCGPNGACWIDPVLVESRCVLECESDADCDGNDVCLTMFDTQGCTNPLPDGMQPPTSRGLSSVQCQAPVRGTTTLTFTIPPGTESYMFVPFSTDGEPVRPVRLTLPNGDRLNFEGEDRQLATTAALLGFTAPVFLDQVPGLSNLVQAGVHDYTVRTDTNELCSYVALESTSTPAQLDLNLYFVGLPDLSAEEGPDDSDLARTLATLDRTFSGVGVTLGEVRYVELEGPDVDDLTVIDERADLGRLVARSVEPGSSDSERLSVNVFLVSTIAIPNSDAIGISQGLPGPPGLHGTPASGVVLTAELLRLGSNEDPGLGAELTGVVMAHEVGHWLGLFHTTELTGTAADPLLDTPECPDIADRLENQSLGGCPDVGNLMFPVAAIANQTLTGDQGDVLRANPVTR